MVERGINTSFKQTDNSLLVKFPIIAMEFDPEKNRVVWDEIKIRRFKQR